MIAIIYFFTDFLIMFLYNLVGIGIFVFGGAVVVIDFDMYHYYKTPEAYAVGVLWIYLSLMFDVKFGGRVCREAIHGNFLSAFRTYAEFFYFNPVKCAGYCQKP